jgi:hypothetical protein
MPASTLMRVRQLNDVFGNISESNFEPILARLSVLYEDLRIELFGIVEESLSKLDQLDAKYRRMYFLRKSIGNLWEFAEAVRHLEKCPEFKLIASEFTPEIARYWERASAFFKRNEDDLKSVRNDIGGHFGLEAARFASQHLNIDAVNGIEMLEPYSERGRVFLRFSGEIVATAMLQHARGKNRDHKITRLVRLARIGYQHATRCAHCIVYCYLWEKFGR